jgi:hypothetical protein
MILLFPRQVIPDEEKSSRRTTVVEELVKVQELKFGSRRAC